LVAVRHDGGPPQRRHFRVVFPAFSRPRLVVQDFAFEVLDLSVGGIRFQLGQAVPPEPGNVFEGELEFRQRQPIRLRATVVRVEGDEASARLSGEIPLNVVLDQQRSLLLRNRHRHRDQ
jgi:PilZ domain